MTDPLLQKIHGICNWLEIELGATAVWSTHDNVRTACVIEIDHKNLGRLRLALSDEFVDDNDVQEIQTRMESDQLVEKLQADDYATLLITNDSTEVWRDG